MRKWLWPALIGLAVAGSWAIALAGTGTISVLDSGSVARTYAIVTNGSGNFVSEQVLCDGSAAANCLQVDTNNSAKVNMGEVGGTAVSLGQTTKSSSIPVTVASDQPSVPGAGVGWTNVLESALSTTVSSVKASAGEFGGYFCYNPNTTVEYIQVFNASSVTLGTTTPLMSLGIPPSSAANLNIQNGINFSTAIQVAATTTPTGSTAPTTALNCNFWFN